MAQSNAQQRASYNSQPYLPNGPGTSGPAPGATPLLPNQGRIIQSGSTKILCIADVRGNLKSLNELAKKNNASYIVHTGDFGFYDHQSLNRIAEKTLKHVAQYSPLLNEVTKRSLSSATPQASVKERFMREDLPLSELPQFLNKTYTLDVPVYTVWGACEDVQVLEKLRSGEYKIDNLHIIDEGHSRLLEVGGVKLRLLGLGGAVVMHKLFDNGEGRTTIAGGQGTMWTTLLQMGELVDTANRVYDPTETRIFVTHASPAREGLLNQLSVTLKADFSISAGLHFRYGSSYNEFSVNPTLDHYRGKLAASKASFNDVWETVRSEVEPAVAENEPQQRLLTAALDLVNKMPAVANGGNPFGGPVGGPASGQVDESAFKNMWNFNLADAAYGQLVLEIEGGRIATEMKAQGFNFAHRGGKAQPNQQMAQGSPAAPVSASTGPVPNAPTQPAAQARVPPQQPAAQSATPPVQQQPAKPAPQQARSGPSTATTPKEPPKPPGSQSTTPGTEKAGDVKTNGTAAESKPAESPVSARPEQQQQQPPPVEKKPPGLFITGVHGEEEARGLFSEENRAKILRVDRHRNAFVAFFGSYEDSSTALAHIPQDNKSNKQDRPNVKPYRYQDGSHGGRGGAGVWQASGRGGPGGQGATGYRSGGGGASDSEGGRGGRGGSFRGRGRGGERGRGRGPRGGERGGFGKGGGGGQGGQAGGGESNAASPAPAPVATGGGGES